MLPKFLALLVLLHIPAFASADKYEPQNGDIIFHTSTSSQSEAVQLVTKSKYSHVGIVYKDGKDAYVLEAVEPVKTTPLKKWIARGVDQRYVVKRLRNAKKLLTAEALKEMKLVAQQFLGKCGRKTTHYDVCFEWTDKRMYCSELVWKIYERALGIEIGERKRLKDFNLSHKAVEKIRKQRKECPFLPDEWVISPADMFASKLLETVFDNSLSKPPAVKLPVPTLRAGTPIYYEGFVDDETWPPPRREKLAWDTKETVVKALFAQADVEFPPAQLLFRSFKKEQQLEVWANSEKNKPMTLIATYKFCDTCGELGPKREKGDYQIPEGFYRARWHSQSTFFLAFRVTYPNRSDCIFGTRGKQGSAIMIHGSCATAGCISIGDGGISELWLMAKHLQNRRPERLQIHMFPSRDMDSLLKQPDGKHNAFWTNIKKGLDYFEEHRIPPRVCIDRRGVYHFVDPTDRCPGRSDDLKSSPFKARDCPR